MTGGCQVGPRKKADIRNGTATIMARKRTRSALSMRENTRNRPPSDDSVMAVASTGANTAHSTGRTLMAPARSLVASSGAMAR